MGVSDPEADPHRRHSMILVPLDTPGVEIVRTLPVFGYDQGHGGHCEVLFDDVRVPADEHARRGGLRVRRSRRRGSGPGRIHHCMRAIGMAERAFDLMCERAHSRVTFGKPLARQGVIREWIAESRIEIEQARLLVLKTAWLMDKAGSKGARIEISAIKVAAPEVAVRVIDRAIQVHGGGGVSNDFPLAAMYAAARTLRIADGPDEVHKLSIARRELRRYEPQLEPSASRSAHAEGPLREARPDRVRDAEPARGQERDRPRDRTSCCGRRGRTFATTTRSTSRS